MLRAVLFLLIASPDLGRRKHDMRVLPVVPVHFSVGLERPSPEIELAFPRPRIAHQLEDLVNAPLI